ncbi:MAG: DNA translocase FtsK 4TM domain-containing protein, partial [Gammaproteobacteria bacterium]|nr:DNA translocase FtsK 4TM domain-containing protein [Gammaproteobacteria bacterium]
MFIVARANAKEQEQPVMQIGRRLREGALLLILAVAAYFLLSLTNYSPDDPGWSYTGTRGEVENAGGPLGAWFADVLLNLFGLFAYLFPLMIGWSGWLLFKERNPDDSLNVHLFALRWTGFLITLAAGSAIASMHITGTSFPGGGGGILGAFLQELLVSMFSFAGSTLLLLALFFSGFTLFSGISWLSVMDTLGSGVLHLYRQLRATGDRMRDARKSREMKRQRSESVKMESKRIEQRPPPRIEPVINKLESSRRVEKEKQVPLFEASAEGDLPPLSLLDPAQHAGTGMSEKALEAMSRLVELKLRDFNVEVEVVAVYPGPVITLFELQLAPGTKASKITNLSKDLARALSTISVRVVEVIPGKSVIGLEIPHENREMVYLSEVLRSAVYDSARSPLTIALGKDIAGNPVVVNLAKMPHVLVAGTTGSGKSVAINAMILSLLFKASPKEVRLIMVDPKMLELSVYEGIPHLLTPVVTDMKEAANALRWCVMEMDRRYRLMAALGVRNIIGFNKKVKEAENASAPIRDPLFKPNPLLEDEEIRYLTKLPYIVIIIDELADMMMVVGKKVEELIARLAQKARAAGVHLLLATQRPSVDVITGLIKANIPSRIAFQVSSRIDSRTILDQMGAESLLGQGDMLYLPPGSGLPVRVHGAYVADDEVHKVAEHWKLNGEPDYIEGILEGGVPESADAGSAVGFGGLSEATGEGEADPLYDQAVAVVLKHRRASISLVQRHLR